MGYRLDPYEIELLWIARAKKRLCKMAAAGAFRNGVACVIDGYHGLKNLLPKGGGLATNRRSLPQGCKGVQSAVIRMLSESETRHKNLEKRIIKKLRISLGEQYDFDAMISSYASCSRLGVPASSGVKYL